MKNKLSESSRIVVKVGTSTLTYSTGLINIRKVESLVRCLSDLQNSGKQVVLVSSGAVSSGFAKIGFPVGHAITTEEKQAAAAVGQCELINMYDRLFSAYGHKVGQVLLTKDVIDDKVRRQHAEVTLKILINMGCIPIINENDTVSSEELRFGGNDTLSAIVAELCEADLLINLSDIDGFFDSDPRTNQSAKLIERVTEITPELEAAAGGAGTGRGTGGMIAKLKAAKMANACGVDMVIANGKEPEILYDILDGTAKCTVFEAKKEN